MEAIATACFAVTPARLLNRGKVIAACALAALTSLASTVYATESDSPNPPAFVTQHLGNSLVTATGTYRWFGLKIYDARVWARQQAIESIRTTGRVDRPLALQLGYARSITGEAIVDSSISEMRKLGVSDEDMLGRWAASMRAAFPDVSSGDKLTGIVDSQGHTHFFFNNMARVSIQDPLFAQAFFAIWLHPDTSAPGLRDKLMKVSVVTP